MLSSFSLLYVFKFLIYMQPTPLVSSYVLNVFTLLQFKQPDDDMFHSFSCLESKCFSSVCNLLETDIFQFCFKHYLFSCSLNNLILIYSIILVTKNLNTHTCLASIV